MKRRWTSLVISGGLALFLCVGFVLGTAVGRAPAYRYLGVFAEVLGLVRGNYVEEVDEQILLRGAYQGMLTGLDAYSGYLTAEQYSSLLKQPQGEADPGLDVVKDGGTLTVVAVWPGSPAEGAAVRVGDRVWAIDGATTREMSLLEARHRLGGPAGSQVVLQMFRVAESKRQDVPLRRELPSCAPFESRIEAPGVGYLRVRSLPRAERASLAAALSDLERRGARKLLLDLRGAARGDMEDALRVAGLFLGDATVARSRERGGGEVEHTSRGPSVWKGSAFLLVNRGTAGAAEILSAALRDRAAARLLGERTCGLGARQDLIRLPSGDGLVLSVARYASPSGFVWHGEGLKEDIPIPLTAAPGSPEAEESQLRRALEIVVEEGRSGAARAA